MLTLLLHALHPAQFMTGSNATINKFTRRMVLVPSMLCAWYGTGNQGCNGPYCYVWIRSDRYAAACTSAQSEWAAAA